MHRARGDVGQQRTPTGVAWGFSNVVRNNHGNKLALRDAQAAGGSGECTTASNVRKPCRTGPPCTQTGRRSCRPAPWPAHTACAGRLPAAPDPARHAQHAQHTATMANHISPVQSCVMRKTGSAPAGQQGRATSRASSMLHEARPSHSSLRSDSVRSHGAPAVRACSSDCRGCPPALPQDTRAAGGPPRCRPRRSVSESAAPLAVRGSPARWEGGGPDGRVKGGGRVQNI